MKNCKNCASENHDNAKFCAECGTVFEKPEQRTVVSKPAAENPEREGTAVPPRQGYFESIGKPAAQEKEIPGITNSHDCAVCGSTLKPFQVFCAKCGTKRDETDIEGRKNLYEKKQRESGLKNTTSLSLILNLIIAAFVFIPLIYVIVAFNYSSSGSVFQLGDQILRTAAGTDFLLLSSIIRVFGCVLLGLSLCFAILNIIFILYYRSKSLAPNLKLLRVSASIVFCSLFILGIMTIRELSFPYSIVLTLSVINMIAVFNSDFVTKLFNRKQDAAANTNALYFIFSAVLFCLTLSTIFGVSGYYHIASIDYKDPQYSLFSLFFGIEDIGGAYCDFIRVSAIITTLLIIISYAINTVLVFAKKSNNMLSWVSYICIALSAVFLLLIGIAADTYNNTESPTLIIELSFWYFFMVVFTIGIALLKIILYAIDTYKQQRI